METRSMPTETRTDSKTLPPTMDSVDSGSAESDSRGLTSYIDHTEWIEAVCGISPVTLAKWTSHIKQKNYFHHHKMVEYLKNFCTAATETSRYLPLAEMMTRIVFLVQGFGPKGERMPDLPSERPPIHDIMFVKTFYKQSNGPSKYAPVAVAVRESQIRQTDEPNNGLKWSHMLFYVKLEHNQRSLEKLQIRRNDAEEMPGHENDAVSTISLIYASCADSAPSPDIVLPSLSDQHHPISATDSGLNACAEGRRGQKRGRDSDSSGQVDLRPIRRIRTTSESSTQPVPPDIKGEEAQMTDYACTLVHNSQGTRAHHIGIFLDDDFLSLWYVDGVGTVRTHGQELSIIDNFDRAMAVIVALAFCGPEQLGSFPPHILHPPPLGHPTGFPPQSLTGCTIGMSRSITSDCEASCVVTLGNHVFNTHSLFGRRTTVYKASLPGDNKLYVAKFSLQRVKKRSEVELLLHSSKHGVQHIPEVIAHRDAWKLSEGVRKYEAFRDEGYTDRVLRLILLPLYTPLDVHLAERPDSLKVMVAQMLQCIQDLRYDAHVLHRDISDSNIMHTMKDGQDWFILNDFDLAIRVNESGKPEEPLTRHHTGTLPFMAVELLRDMHDDEIEKTRSAPVSHCIRFDYQSLLWVSLWCAISIMPQGTPVAEVTLREKCLLNWEKGSCKALANQKSVLLDETSLLLSLPFSPLFKHLDRWFLVFQEPFANTRHKESRLLPEDLAAVDFQEFEEGYGEITLKRFQRSFRAYEKRTAPKVA